MWENSPGEAPNNSLKPDELPARERYRQRVLCKMNAGSPVLKWNGRALAPRKSPALSA